MEPVAFRTQIERLRSIGWSCRWGREAVGLPSHVQSRYPWVPSEYKEFLSALLDCVSPAETTWILPPADFAGTSDSAFAWDEWERLSLDSADGDEGLISEIRTFWDSHIPICLSIGDGYSFYAIRVSDQSGLVVTGREPEFEDACPVAASFTEFLSKLT
jgi:hypothetical protein